MNPLTMIGRLSSVYSIGKKIKNHIFTRRNFQLLLKKHSVMLVQLQKANEIISQLDDELSKDYCDYYAIPRKKSEDKGEK